MRLANGIISLALMFVIGFQSCALSIGAALSKNAKMSNGAGTGIMLMLFYLIGGAFAFKKPKISMIIYIVAALIGLMGGSTTSFKDLTFWGIVALALGIMSFFGGRESKEPVKRSEKKSKEKVLEVGEYKIYSSNKD